MLMIENFAGEETEIGKAHGRAFRHGIASNLSHFVEHPNSIWSHLKEGAKLWFHKLRDRHFETWPWLYDEIRGISDGANIPFDLIQQLNFRIWQYPFYGQSYACSSFVITLQDGTIATGGSLDDPRWAYECVRIKPAKGLEFVTFPLAGTVWGNRGMNSAGLVLNISSLPLSGFRFDTDSVWQQDICFRLMLQTCTSCQEAIEFCRKYPCFANILVADKSGTHSVFSCNPIEVKTYSPSIKCITNHALEEHTTFFRSNGWNGKIESSTSLSRYVQLASWIAQNERKITESGVLESICDRKNEQSDINNSTTAFMMLAIPKHTKMWIADMPVTVEKFHEITFD